MPLTEAQRILLSVRSPPDAPPLPVALPASTIAAVKAYLGPSQPPSAWLAAGPRHFALSGAGVSLSYGGSVAAFHDTAPRVPFAAGTYAASGSDLPHTPTVLTGVGAEWQALQGEGWSLPSLAARCSASDAFSLDGGPGFARETLSVGSVSMAAFAEYASGAAGGDSAPLYIFDDSLSTRCFADGTPMASEFTIPACFSADTMLSCAGGQARPLPPSWLLVGPSGSGTPVHSHPFTVGWCTLLHGTKLWVLLPPHVDPGLLQVGEHNTTSGEEDLSALQWMMQWGGGGEGLTLLQRAGETVFIPAGWWHVVLNVTVTVALSHSLYLARDLAVHGMAASAEAQAVGSAWAAGVAGSAAEGGRGGGR